TQTIRSTTCWLPAACFIRPQSTMEVKIALKIITTLQSTFAVRTVGHNPNPGFSSVDESGVVIDLRELKNVEIAPGRDVVSIGPGAMWGEVYDVLEEEELTVVGGRVSEVGVGGLLLGGGMSHFSNRWGMACDNVKIFEVVLANSEVVYANEHENQDLFRALKGGGPNFGIVTRFDLYTYPDYKVWYTFKMYSADDTERVMKAVVEVQKAMETDDRIGLFLTCAGNFFVAGMLHLGWTDSPVPAFKALDEITPMMVTVPEMNGTAASVATAVSMNEAAKRESGTLTVLPDVDLYVEVQGILHGIKSSATTSESYSLVFTYQPVAKASVKEGNSLNVSPVNQAWLAIAITWIEDSEDDLARKQIRELISGIEVATKGRGLLLNFKFMNDASYIQSPLRSYGIESLELLHAARQKWDPESVFQRLQNGGFLLSRA
ncbi:FAD-binding domain-containing protein, partial [Cadophora sp. DSE1049]